MASIDEALVGREQREDNYRKWSERAVVVGYNSENQSYDIVVTTERLVGANKRTLNKTIRRVKSILDSTVRVFLPGEAITIGYLSDKREHPIILGLGDNVVQTPAKVTLGPTLNVEGGSPPLSGEDGFVTPLPISISCELDAIAGVTCSIDCTVSLPTIIFRASGGAGFYTWLVATPPAGCSFRGIGGVGEPIPDGVNNSRLVITAPFNAGGAGVAAYEDRIGTGACDSTCPGVGQAAPCNGSDCCNEQGNGTFITRDCNGDPVAGSCDNGLPVGPILYIQSDDARQTACAAAFGWFETSDVCQSIRDRDATGSLIVDIRSPAQIVGECCPCDLVFSNLIVTVSDDFGSQISQTVTVGIV